MPRIVPVKARRLTSKVGRICQKYIQDLEGMFRKHKVLERLKEIAQTSSFPASREAEVAFEKLDKEMSMLMLTVEKDYRKLYPN